MAAVTTLPSASVITTLSNQQGVSTSVQQPSVQVTATTGSTAITTMMGPPGPPGPSAASDGIFNTDVTVTGEFPTLTIKSTQDPASSFGILSFADNQDNELAYLTVASGEACLQSMTGTLALQAMADVRILPANGTATIAFPNVNGAVQLTNSNVKDTRLDLVENNAVRTSLGNIAKSFTEYGPTGAVVSINSNRRTFLDSANDAIVNVATGKKIMLGVNSGSNLVVSSTGAIVRGTLDASGAIKQNGSQVFHAGNLSFGSGLSYNSSTGSLTATATGGSTLSIGELTTLPAGSAPTATVTGTASNQVLNIGFPTAANGSGGSSLYQRPYRPGSWYPVNVGGIGNGSAAGADTLLWCPFVITQTVTVDSLLTRITTASSTGSIRIYLFAAGPSYWAYGAPLAATAVLSAAVSQIVQGDVTPVTLAPGLYWFAYHASDSTVAVANGAHLEAANIMGHDDPTRTLPANGQAPWGFRSNGVSFAAGPPTITTAPNYYSGSGVNRLPTGFFRVAAQ